MTLEKKVMKAYGTTQDKNLAVWLLRDGTLVNGSHSGTIRDVDHHEISRFFSRSKFEKPGETYLYIKKFMNRGNIRIGCSMTAHCYEFTVPPSSEQLTIMYGSILSDPCCIARPMNGLQTWMDDLDFLKYVARYMRKTTIPMNIREYYQERTGLMLCR